ncbi:hypothetical protein [Parageobacillus thermoglucosidasius]|uniref:hypothetical protein n=1 Tax=Parageobacillus thermoglucosidasius TaxID=1426 RepID=UPI000B55E3F6|nr:hypothetical protein [Parageobacillus thermoglucosidasius]MBY6268613.1 hypothetical protein [Parageobacillus thermoglucosidasius]MED4905350.1 hypothetical protein [Parageobacillus thermoglucosidasius]MED4913577.1 hypothetical protein [Parageobacillus thermoglucosidasius]MED4944016.1 hypothetical protein [Parageobacillus thermoglucosidasius]MED4984423.1 hypothetical protein [Parageobacillus thermoglucosidasius]
MATQWLEQFVKYQGLSGDFWEFVDKEGINREELERQLQKYELDTFTKRSRFLWKLQAVVEKIISEHPNEQNSDVADLVVKEWNDQFQPAIDKFAVRAMLDHLPIRHDMMRRAFHALCSGNFPSYELYTQGNPQLFVQLFVRTSVQFVDRPGDVFSLGETVLPSLFKGIYARKEVMRALRSLLMTRRDHDTADYKMMNQYGQVFSPDELVFNKGMLSIIIPILKEKDDKEVVANFLRNVSEKAKHLLVEEASLMEVERLEAAEAGEQKELQPVENVETIVEKAASETEAAVSSSLADQETIQQLIKEVDEFSARIKESLRALEQRLTGTSGLANAVSTGNEEVVAQLREENERLYMEIEQIKQQQTEIEWKRLKQFIQAVGGNQHHYLLSELYEESQGTAAVDSEITRGRLVNLFNAFSLFGLEPTAYGYEIGQELTLTRQELRERFMMLHPIASSTNEVRVKITRYGWMIYGQVIVQPLVEEVAE